MALTACADQVIAVYARFRIAGGKDVMGTVAAAAPLGAENRSVNALFIGRGVMARLALHRVQDFRVRHL